jgi:hypothetical protein
MVMIRLKSKGEDFEISPQQSHWSQPQANHLTRNSKINLKTVGCTIPM